VIVAADELAPGGMAAPGAPLRRYAAVWGAAPVPDLAEATAALAAALADAPAERAGQPALVQAAATVLAYARATQPGGTLPIARLACYQPGATMVLDEAAIANLELCQTLVGARRQGSLLDVLDDTTTAPGARLLRRWLLYPLTDRAAIAQRADAVADYLAAAEVRRELRRELKATSDLERLAGKATLGVAGPRDLGRLRDTLLALPALAALAVPSPRLDGAPTLTDLRPVATPALATLAAHLDAALVEQPGAQVKDGGFVRPGFDAVVDECRGLADGGKDAIAAIEARERERTGIGSLKVRYNRVFGYYIEITKSQLARVPDDYLRKQTVAGAERYVTRELAELEAKVLAAQDTLAAREAELHRALVAEVAGAVPAAADRRRRDRDDRRVPGLGRGRRAPRLDVRPTVDDSAIVEIKDGRHPVIEALVPAGTFVPNDARLDADREQVVLVTGPNMAGKSTFMRQVAHIVILAQLGSFVPASAATIGVCDRVFTRVGATDNLARGDSTFMVEMRETAAILAHATRRSLVILDEVGRGTSTFDGVSIAWAVAEYLHDASARGRCSRRTITSWWRWPTIGRACTTSRRWCASRTARWCSCGASSPARRRSYGIDVARLAGLPRSVIARARAILARLEGDGAALPSGRRLAQAPPGQLSLLPALAAAVDAPTAEVAQRLRALDPDRMTPIAALAALAELRALLS
jgi:DNA mismatch repair protein MutS